MRDLFVAFLLGALVAAGGAFWHETRQTEEFRRALRLLKSGEEATAYSRAMAAYRQEEPSIAIWELNKLVSVEQENLNLNLETNATRMGLMLTHARLAKLFSTNFLNDLAVCLGFAIMRVGADVRQKVRDVRKQAPIPMLL